MALNIIGECSFEADDQLRFAELSRDYNPMHLDAAAARRTMAGSPVVHGMHTLCRVLDSVSRLQPDLATTTSIKAAFRKMVYPGDRLKISITKDGPARCCVSASVGNATVLSAEFGKAASPLPSVSVWGEVLLSDYAAPASLGMHDVPNCSGRISAECSLTLLEAMFPFATAALGSRRMMGLVRLSYLVGMVCPGLHSIFAGLDMAATQIDDGTENNLEFQVRTVDERFRKVVMAVNGSGWSGSVDAFLRSAPQTQPSSASLARYVGPGEFSGTHALIVGGSRGVGELTAKLIACGGGHVTVTYTAGEADARRVQSDIVGNGGTCDLVRYDVRKNGGEQLAKLKGDINQLYFMATPQIFGRSTADFDAGRFQTFVDFYVTGFQQTCMALTAKVRHPVQVFYPSSVAVAERPKGMAEYSKAKAAGEMLCADLQSSGEIGSILVERLPRLPTDQTATLIEVASADPVAVMLPILRKMNCNVAGAARST